MHQGASEMTTTTTQSLPSSDELFAQIFGADEALPSVTLQIVPILPKPPRKTFATFSQLMTLAHNFNRKHGKQVVRGCKCRQCEINKVIA